MEKLNKVIPNDILAEEEKIRKSMSAKEYEEYCLKEKVDFLNSQKGHLEYYDCPKCLNRGYVNKIIKTEYGTSIVAENCECKKLREIAKNLQESGISSKLLNECDIENYKCIEPYEQKVKEKVKAYMNYVKETNDDNWFVYSAQSGAGKTTKCTYIFKNLILSGKSGKYMLWKDDIIKLKAFKKSSYSDNQEKYEKIMNDFKAVDVLYIDDFFKLIDKNSMNEDLNLAYEILNARYNNQRITIISTELKKADIQNLDNAIFGRIYEMTKKGVNWIELKFDSNRDYRLKKNEEF